MRIPRSVILFSPLVMVALLCAIPGQAGEKTPFTAVGYISGLLEPGTTTCPGYPDVQPPCPGRTNVRGFVFTQTLASSDSPLQGDATVELNYNIDRYGEGQYWGKWSIALPDGGVLEGNYAGRITWTGNYLRAVGKGELHGTGGALDGCLVQADSDANFSDHSQPDIYTGYILNPHSKK